MNYFRICYIAFNLVPEGLRKVFKREWDFRYNTYKTSWLGEWKDTPKNGLDFNKNESPKSHRKNARFLLTILNGNTAEWDCSCLFFAILFSDSIGASLSPVVQIAVNDLRQVRNDIAHISEAELSETDFRNYVDRVLFAFTSLRLPCSEIEEVKNQTTFPTAEVNRLKVQVDDLNDELIKAKSDLQDARNVIQTQEERAETLKEEINSKVESFCNLTFKPSHEIILRGNDVTRIMEKMKELKDVSSGRISTIYLSGIPGCGKSQLASQLGKEFFKRRWRRSDPSGLVFVATLDAESLETLADSYLALAKQLGITEYALTNLAIAKSERPKETLQHLKLFVMSKTRTFNDWLIIVDNVVDLSLIHGFVPENGNREWGNGQVLITTQDTRSLPFNGTYTYHESLSEGMLQSDTVELLRQVSNIANQEQIGKVAEVLEYQPLALAAAAFYVQTVVRNGSPCYNWTKFLETLQNGRRAATEGPLAEGSLCYSKTMTTAIALALNRTFETDAVLRETFSFLKLCASESLPIQAAVDFVCFRTGMTEELIRAKILKSSFILCSCDKKNQALMNIRVHDIVHEVLQKMNRLDPEQFTETLEATSAAIRIFNSLIDEEIALPSHDEYTYTQLRRIVSHCKALLENPSCRSGREGNLIRFIPRRTVIRWLCSTADICCKLSYFSRANFFCCFALDLVKDEGGKVQENAVAAYVFTVYGKVLSMQSQPARSIPYHEKAIKMLDEIQGEDKLSMLMTNYNSLGRVYRTIGQHDKAEKSLKKAMDICINMKRTDNVLVATSYSHLGLVYYDMGKHKQAKEFHMKALDIREKAFGEKHGDVAASYNNLGIASYNVREYKEAKEFHEKALAIRRSIFGEEHFDVAASYNNLALVACRNGQYDQAKELHEKALKIRRKVFDVTHSDVSASYNNLGVVCYRLGKYSEALEMHKKGLEIARSLFGQTSLIATNLDNVARVFSALGKDAEERECKREVLEINSEKHHQVVCDYDLLGNPLDDFVGYKRANEFHEEVLAETEEFFSDLADSIDLKSEVGKPMGIPAAEPGMIRDDGDIYSRSVGNSVGASIGKSATGTYSNFAQSFWFSPE